MPIKLLKSILLLVAVSGVFTKGYATERRYIAEMAESRWEMTQSNNVFCEMEHAIPLFGKAVFSRAAGRKLQLRLESHERYMSGLGVELRSESPVWKPIKTLKALASLKTTNDNSLVKIPASAARNAYLQLQDGNQPSFFFFENQNDDDSMIISMSSVRFRNIEPKFESCLGNLYHKNFDDIKLASIHFDHDEEFPLIEEEDTALEPMLNYLQVDSAISHIVVSGHADLNGAECYNDTLSARRAWYVYDLLVSKGIEPKLIRVDFFGENQPLKKGKSESVLAANRRVTVSVVR